MKALFLLTVAFSGLFLGCRPSGSSGVSSSNGITAGFEGAYFVVSRPEDSVIMTNGVYVGARANNPGGDMNGAGKYTARKIDDTTWELDVVHYDGGTSVVVVRKQGDSIWIKDKAFGAESELKKK